METVELLYMVARSVNLTCEGLFLTVTKCPLNLLCLVTSTKVRQGMFSIILEMASEKVNLSSPGNAVVDA